MASRAGASRLNIDIDADLKTQLDELRRFFGNGSLSEYVNDMIRERVQRDWSHFEPAILLLREKQQESTESEADT